jgi:putative SOS response-associated peptidase YedK
VCGRYSLTRRQAEIIERFGVEQMAASPNNDAERYNVAPTQDIPVVFLLDEKRTLAEFRWGLIPYWTKDPKKSKPMINARSESVAEKAFFKGCLERRRCLIPASGFYEWQKTPAGKIPMNIHLEDQKLFAFAGLWDQWKSPDGSIIRSCTILTTSANALVAGIHDRMPVILEPQSEALWLDHSVKDYQRLAPLFKPYSRPDMACFPVSPLVNSAKSDDAQLLIPLQF